MALSYRWVAVVGYLIFLLSSGCNDLHLFGLIALMRNNAMKVENGRAKRSKKIVTENVAIRKQEPLADPTSPHQHINTILVLPRLPFNQVTDEWLLIEINFTPMAMKTEFHRRENVQARRKEKLILYLVVIAISLWAMIVA